MTNRIVFLDIDGPIIPFSAFLIDRMASLNRIVQPIPVAVVTDLCKRTGAKVVFNTTHNTPMPRVADIEVVMELAGLPHEYIHPDMKTKYPQLPRETSVMEWLSRHSGEVDDWIAFDDVRFTGATNLIWVDPDAGLHLGHLNQALRRWGCEQFLIL